MRKSLIMSFVLSCMLVLNACGTPVDAPSPNNDVPLKTQDEPVQDIVASDEEDDGFFEGTLKDLMAFDKSQKCSMLLDGKLVGEVFMDEKRIMSDTNTSIVTEDGQNMDISMSMIDDGEYIYSWDKIKKEGTKMKSISEEESMENEPIDDGNMNNPEEAVDDIYSYECEDWSVDEAVFSPPSDIVFTDIDEIMNQEQAKMTELVDDMDGLRAMCDAVPPENKEDCLKSIQEAEGL